MSERRKRLVVSGDEMFNRAEQEEKKMAAKRELAASGMGRVFRFWVPEGETRKLVILDKDLRSGRSIHEHNLKGPDGKFGNYRICVAEADTCPWCTAYPDNKPYFVSFLTVLDLHPFTIKKGTKDEKEISFSRKLLAMKSTTFKQMRMIQEAVLEEYDTLRGTYLEMSRPEGQGQGSTNVGAPRIIKGTGGKSFGYYEESILVDRWGSPARKDKATGKVIAPANAEIQPYDYAKLFPEPTDEDIEGWREELGLGTVAGSKKDAIEEWDKDEGERLKGKLKKSAWDDDSSDDDEGAGFSAPKGKAKTGSAKKDPEPSSGRRRSRGL